MKDNQDYVGEDSKILEFISLYGNGSRVLDVGCGYGRILRLLSGSAFKAVGVEANAEIVESCRLAGLECISPDEFDNSPKQEWDVIIMSHIIEHFSPRECFNMIDHYLDYLKGGGILIIATPLLTEYFYEDFDHIKPYLPLGINMVFGVKSAQVQYRSRNKLQLLDLWYKKYFYRATNSRDVYLNDTAFFPRFTKFFLKIIFIISFGYFGKKDGWVGVFRKIL